MKQISIDTKNLLEAPVDETNVCSSVLFDLLFNGDYTWGEDGKDEAVGFVGGYPTYAHCSVNSLILSFSKENGSARELIMWCSTVVESLTGNDYKAFRSNNLLQYYNECDNIISTFRLNGKEIEVSFHYNQKQQ